MFQIEETQPPPHVTGTSAAVVFLFICYLTLLKMYLFIFSTPTDTGSVNVLNKYIHYK